jgi:hypothetical protein
MDITTGRQNTIQNSKPKAVPDSRVAHPIHCPANAEGFRTRRLPFP